MNFVGPEVMFGVSTATMKVAVREWLHDKHLTRWTRYEEARQTKLLCRAPSEEIIETILNLSSSDIKNVFESITIHCSLNKCLFDINCMYSPPCLSDFGNETGYQIICLCPRYRSFGKLIMSKSELIDSDLILNSKVITNLGSFLEKPGRFL